MVNRLGRDPEYEGKVLWLEHDVDDRSDTRGRRWWLRKQADDPEARSATTPLILVDSGRTYGDGRTQPFEAKYRELVDEALTELPRVAIDASFQRDRRGNGMMIAGTITNVGAETIGYDNTATLWLMAFEEEQVIHVDWFVRAVASFAIEDDLEPGQTMTFDEAVMLPSTADIEKAQVVVMVDFKSPIAAGAYISANSALARSGEVAPEPTPETPTGPPPDPTTVPTTVPAPNGGGPLYLPAALDRSTLR